jgi:hypothetical protein
VGKGFLDGFGPRSWHIESEARPKRAISSRNRAFRCLRACVVATTLFGCGNDGASVVDGAIDTPRASRGSSKPRPSRNGAIDDEAPSSNEAADLSQEKSDSSGGNLNEPTESVPTYKKSAAVHQYSGAILALGDPWLHGATSGSATAHCGDGARIPSSSEEDCDSGAVASDACSASCRTKDFLAAGTSSAMNVKREFGRSTHSIAGHPLAPGGVSAGAVTWQEASSTSRVLVQLLDRHGNRLGTNPSLVDGRYDASPSSALVELSEGRLPTSLASPVIAPVYPLDPVGATSIDPRIAEYVIAWNELGGEGSDLGIAFRKITVDTSGLSPSITLGDTKHPSDGAVWGQQDPDLIALPGGNVILTWTDMRNPATAPDIRFREFSESLVDIGEFPLAETSAVEGTVSLATVPGDSEGFFYAFREARSDGGETIVVGRRSGFDLDASSTVRVDAPIVSGKVLGPGPEGERPTLVGLDTNRALVVFSVGTDPNSTGVFQIFRLRAAVVDVTTNEVRGAGYIEPLVAPYSTDSTISLTHPVLVEAGSDGLFLAWQSSALIGNTAAEELWLKKIDWSPTASGMGLTLSQAEMALPREAAHQPGDQRAPSLAVLSYPGGGRALGMGWEDWGTSFGAEAARPDIALQIAPLPLARLSAIEQACSPGAKCATGEGPCNDDADCTSGLCQPGRGPHRGYAPAISVCETAACTNGVQDGSETGIDCGGSCGKCFTCPAVTPYSGTAHYCSAVCPCATLKGDCDGDIDCVSGQVCASDAGPQVNLNSFTDICLPPECTNGTLDNSETRTDCGGPHCAPCQVGSPNFCSTSDRCETGEGHCDESGECIAGVCAADQGPFYGFPSGVAVCVPSACAVTSARGEPGDAEFCTSTCACADGIGVCDSNEECLGNASALTKCVAGRGVNYGYANESKVCIPTHCFDGIANADESQVDCGGTCGNYCPRCGGLASVRHFETTADWARPSYASGGSAPTLVASTDSTNGTYSLKATGSTYEELWSRDFTADELDIVGSKVYVDIKHLAASPPTANTWIGSIELRIVFVDGTSSTLIPVRDFLQGVNSDWVTLEGDVDTRLQTALRSRSARFKLEIRVDRTQTTDTFVDNLRFGGDATPITDCYDGTGGAVNGPSEVSLGGSTSSVGDMLSFESTSNWTGDPTASVVTNADPTLGANSLSVTQASGSKATFTSTEFASSALAAAFAVGLTQKLTLDVKTPPPATNQTLSGSIRLVLACPSADIWWSDVIGIATLPENQWTRARFTFPRALKTNLNTTGIDCALRLESELAGQATSSAILYDNLRFESETPCASSSYTLSNSAPFLTNMPGPPDGSAKRPYPICNTAQLTTVRNSSTLRDSHFILMQDLDLAGWNSMISANGAPFRGTFDGQGHAIRNHSFQQAGAYVGLFGRIEGDTTVNGTLDGMIRNLRIENSNVGGAYAIAALAGYAGSARIHNVIATNAVVAGTADSLGAIVGWGANGTRIVDSAGWDVHVTTATAYAGGLAGYYTGSVKNCRTSGVVQGAAGFLGGLVGELTAGDISDSFSSVNVDSPLASVSGGLVGNLSGKLTNSRATGWVTGRGANGGLIGRANNSQIMDCSASGPVLGTAFKTDWGAGGLLGQVGTNVAISRSSATGTVSSSSFSCVGGLVGLYSSSSGSASTITDSYARGSVAAYSGAGGLVGCIYNTTIARSYSAGVVQFVGTNYASGAFIGWRGGVNTYSASAVLSPSNPALLVVGGSSTPPGMYRFAVSLFQSSAAFAELGWDFDDIWIMGPNGPELR